VSPEGDRTGLTISSRLDLQIKRLGVTTAGDRPGSFR
jgi:hypothetical protein